MKKSKRNYIRNVLTYLEPISKVPPKRRNNIVPLLSDETIHKLCESCQNLLQNTYDLDKRKLGRVTKKLKPMAKDVRSLASPTTSLLRKRKLLANQQIGGSLFTIIAFTIIPALLSAIAK